MARIFVTGSSDGLGRLAARILVERGHAVLLHARDGVRQERLLARCARLSRVELPFP